MPGLCLAHGAEGAACSLLRSAELGWSSLGQECVWRLDWLALSLTLTQILLAEREIGGFLHLFLLSITVQSSLRFSQVKICQIQQNQVVVLIKKRNSVLGKMLLWSLRIWCCSAFNPQPPVCLNVKKKKNRFMSGSKSHRGEI